MIKYDFCFFLPRCLIFYSFKKWCVGSRVVPDRLFFSSVASKSFDYKAPNDFTKSSKYCQTALYPYSRMQ